MDAVVAFIANGEATKPVEPGERALDDPETVASLKDLRRALGPAETLRSALLQMDLPYSRATSARRRFMHFQ